MIQFIHNHSPIIIEDAGGEQIYSTLRTRCTDLSVRYGCGTGHCGACTVLINDQAENSCSTPTWSLGHAQVITPQGLKTDPIGSIVLESFLDEQAAQCAYCVNGIMMRLTGLFKKSPNASDQDILDALSRHLCRCGAHARILRAAKRARDKIQNLEVNNLIHNDASSP